MSQYNAAAVEVAMVDAHNGAFEQLPADTVAGIVNSFLTENPVVEDDTDESM